jgi:hypothetical protein
MTIVLWEEWAWTTLHRLRNGRSPLRRPGKAASNGMVRELLRFRVATTLERVRLQGLAEALDRMPHGGWFQEQHPSGTIRTVWIVPPPGTPLGKGSGS